MDVKPEWFGHNKDAMDLYQHLRKLTDIWDDLVDQDRAVTPEQINDAFLTCLFRLPMNPVYKLLESSIAPMWVSVISAYEAANFFEKNKDQHGLEISHVLRYSVGNIVSFVVSCCVGTERAREYMPDVWKTMIGDRFFDYKKEHS